MIKDSTFIDFNFNSLSPVHFQIIPKKNWSPDSDYSLSIYNGSYQFAFEVAQIISQNEMNRSISNILLKHEIKSKNTKKLVDKKNILEEILLKQSKDLSNSKLDENSNKKILGI